VADSNPRIIKDPKPEAFFLGFGESALNLELRFWAAQSIWFELKSEMGLAVVQSFRKAGIEIPYPQRDLHVRSLDYPVKKEPSSVSDGEGLNKTAAGR
jgi:small-conductance mechanosensitive channel